MNYLDCQTPLLRELNQQLQEAELTRICQEKELNDLEKIVKSLINSAHPAKATPISFKKNSLPQ